MVLRVGDRVSLGVANYGRLYVEQWGGTTTVHGRLVGIELHAHVGEGPGVSVEDTDQFDHEELDYAYELTVATRDWLPHR
jgi:hypothetical protein